MNQEINLSLLPKQVELMLSNKREILYSSGYGGGKTRGGLYKLFQHASVPDSYCGLFRNTRKDLVDITLHTLLEPESNMPPILPKGSYVHNKQDSFIKINGGGKIIYKGFDFSSGILGLNLSCAFIDESILCDEEQYNLVNSRIRNTNSLCRQLWSCTNPGSKSHFLYKRFFQKGNNDRQIIHSAISDNIFLPQDFLDTFKEYDKKGIYYRRYYSGEWCNNEYAVYSNFSEENIGEHEFDEGNEQIFLGIDLGYVRDPTAILVCGYDGKKFYLYEEHVLHNKLLSDILDILEQYREYKPVLCVDPSAAGMKNEFRNAGYNVLDKVNNKIIDGIAVVKNLINNREILIDPRNKETLKEIDLYSYGSNGSDLPVDSKNHCMDALRYCVMGVLQARQKIIKPNIVFLGNEDNNDD